MTAAGDRRRAARLNRRTSPPPAELEAVVRHAGVPVVLVHPASRRILEVSDTAAATVGISRAQLLEGSLDQILAPAVLDDTAMNLLRSRVDGYWTRASIRRGDGGSFTADLVVRTFDYGVGRLLLLLVLAVPGLLDSASVDPPQPVVGSRLAIGDVDRTGESPTSVPTSQPCSGTPPRTSSGHRCSRRSTRPTCPTCSPPSARPRTGRPESGSRPGCGSRTAAGDGASSWLRPGPQPRPHLCLRCGGGCHRRRHGSRSTPGRAGAAALDDRPRDARRRRAARGRPPGQHQRPTRRRETLPASGRS